MDLCVNQIMLKYLLLYVDYEYNEVYTDEAGVKSVLRNK